MLSPGFGVALWELWGGFGVALGWLWSRNRLPINTLWGGFDVALVWVEWFQLSAFQPFSFCQSVALVGLRGAPPLFLLSTFCFLLLPGGGFGRLFKVRGSGFKVQGSVSAISIPNTTPLSRRPRAGLGAPWYHPGHTLVP